MFLEKKAVRARVSSPPSWLPKVRAREAPVLLAPKLRGAGSGAVSTSRGQPHWGLGPSGAGEFGPRLMSLPVSGGGGLPRPGRVAAWFFHTRFPDSERGPERLSEDGGQGRPLLLSLPSSVLSGASLEKAPLFHPRAAPAPSGPSCGPAGWAESPDARWPASAEHPLRAGPFQAGACQALRGPSSPGLSSSL